MPLTLTLCHSHLRIDKGTTVTAVAQWLSWLRDCRAFVTVVPPLHLRDYRASVAPRLSAHLANR